VIVDHDLVGPIMDCVANKYAGQPIVSFVHVVDTMVRE